MNLDRKLYEKALHWSQSESFDVHTRNEIQNLLDREDSVELSNRFYRDLEFGTGGMRGLMGAGTARFNSYNVRRATHALALYLRKQNPTKSTLRVALSYDSRNNSRLYAEHACAVLISHGIECFLTEEMRPVPLLSFMVRYYECDAGVCITASHNPAAYNGYKIYWNSGCQLTPPHDEGILKFYKESDDYAELPTLSFEEASRASLFHKVSKSIDAQYLKKLESLSFMQGDKDLQIVYTPLHGTGVFLLPQALKAFGFHKVHVLAEQSEPNGDFPTVAAPNPEDPRALDLALRYAKAHEADLVLGTDPDADRLAVIVREVHEWKSFTGNQMGALLFDYVLKNLHKQNRIPAQAFTVKTIVTSELLRKISESYGVPCEETLTGFKWICSRIDEYESGQRLPYREFICGAEESYGFLADSFVRDKDAVLSAAVASEMLAFYKRAGKTLTEVLDALYLKFGLYCDLLENLSFMGKEGEEKMKSLMQALRTYPPTDLGSHRIVRFKDYLHSVERVLQEDETLKDAPLDFPKTDLLEYESTHCKLSIRPSGTEPKMKIYLSLHKEPGLVTRDNLHSQKQTLAQEAQELMSAFLTVLSS